MHPSSYNDFDDGRPHRPGVSINYSAQWASSDAEEAHQRVGYKAAGTLIPYFHFFAKGPVVVNGREFCRPRVIARKSDEQRDHISTDDILSFSEGLNSDNEAPWKADGKELNAERLAKELRGHRGDAP